MRHILYGRASARSIHREPSRWRRAKHRNRLRPACSWSGDREAGTYTMKFYAKHVSVGEFDDQYFQVSFDSEPPSEDEFDLSRPDHPYLIVQRQFEDDDGGVCYIETHDHDAYAGHFRLQLIEFTATRLFFEIARAKDKYVEVAYDLDAKKFGEVQRIIQIVFGVQG
jgi:hypothetical protein